MESNITFSKKEIEEMNRKMKNPKNAILPIPIDKLDEYLFYTKGVIGNVDKMLKAYENHKKVLEEEFVNNLLCVETLNNKSIFMYHYKQIIESCKDTIEMLKKEQRKIELRIKKGE